MNFIRSRLSLASLLGQRRQVTRIYSHRWMCDKLQEPKAASSPAKPAQDPHLACRINTYSPSDFERKLLIWSGRFKSLDQIPATVPSEIVNSAKSRIRIMMGYILIAAILMGCMLMAYMGRKAAGRHENLTALNLKKKAKWMEELKTPEGAAAASDKAQ